VDNLKEFCFACTATFKAVHSLQIFYGGNRAVNRSGRFVWVQLLDTTKSRQGEIYELKVDACRTVVRLRQLRWQEDVVIKALELGSIQCSRHAGQSRTTCDENVKVCGRENAMSRIAMSKSATLKIVMSREE
jgi:hypothetical protein